MNVQVYFLVNMITIVTAFRTEKEPYCSLYDYNEKVQSKLIRVEHRLELMEEFVKSKITEIESKKSAMEVGFKSLSDNLKTSQTADIEKMKAKVDLMTDGYTRTIEGITSQASSTLKDLEDTIPGRTTVFAHYYGSTDDHLSNGEAIIFGTLVQDTHNAYSTTTGCFDTPVEGLYLIVVQITVESDDTIEVCTWVNESIISYARLNKSSAHGSLNSVTVVDLKSHDIVCIKAGASTSSGDLILSPEYRWNFITIAKLN